MASLQEYEDGPFLIQRVLPKGLSEKEEHNDKMPLPRQGHSYSVTSDEQRYRFIQKIISKELTVKEVLPFVCL
jgi:hypothetical protein